MTDEHRQPITSLTQAATPTVSEYMRSYWTRVKAGDLGSIPIIAGIIVIAIIFQLQSDVFLSSVNFVNLIRQLAGLTVIAIGVVFVLLIAEIDLSVAYVSGVVAVLAILMLRDAPNGPDWPAWLAIAFALVIAACIGLLHGVIITKARVPSFVVTLAGFLGWSGVVLILTLEITSSGTILIQDDFTVGIANNFMTDAWGWIVAFIAIGAWAGVQFLQRASRSRAGLPVKPLPILAAQIAAIAVITLFAVAVANRDRGVPLVALLVGALLVFWTFIASRTRFGRHVYAVGGNPEAARRAGINVDRIRISVFMIASVMAGIGGIILASRLRSVDPGTGGGNLLLNAIAAAVIGGTSLFGGQGRVMAALVGAIVIQSVDNGMGLLGLPSGVKFVVTALILLAAVLLDSFSKRAQQASGIA